MTRLSLAAAVLFASALLAADPPPAGDQTRSRLNFARADYEQQVAAARRDVLAALEKREAVARQAGDKKAVDQVKAERDAFEQRDDLPTVVAATGYERAVGQARARLDDAYQAAVKEYVQAKQDAAAGVAEKDLAAFRAAAPAWLAALPKDSSWAGRKVHLGDDGKPDGKPLSLTLRVTDRAAAGGFRGVLGIDKRRYDVAGTVSAGRVSFVTEKSGRFQHAFQGRVTSAGLDLTFAGTTVTGERVKGTAALAPAKGK